MDKEKKKGKKKPELNFSQFVKQELFNDIDRAGLENALQLMGLDFNSFDDNDTSIADFEDIERNFFDALISKRQADSDWNKKSKDVNNRYDRAIEKVKQNTQNLIDTESIGESYKIYLEASKDSKKQSIIFICRLREGIGDFFSMQLALFASNTHCDFERISKGYVGKMTQEESFAKAIGYFGNIATTDNFEAYLKKITKKNDASDIKTAIKNTEFYKETYNFLRQFSKNPNNFNEALLISQVCTQICLGAAHTAQKAKYILQQERGEALRPDMLFNFFFTKENKMQVLSALGSGKEEGKSLAV